MWNIPQCGKYVNHFGKIFYNTSTSDCGTLHFYYPCKKIDFNFFCSYFHSEDTRVLSYFLFDSVRFSIYPNCEWMEGLMD